MLRNRQTIDIETSNSHNAQRNHDWQNSARSNLAEIHLWSLYELASSVTNDTRLVLEWTGNEGQYWNKDETVADSEDPLDPYHLQRLNIVFIEYLLLVCVEESTEYQWADQ